MAQKGRALRDSGGSGAVHVMRAGCICLCGTVAAVHVDDATVRAVPYTREARRSWTVFRCEITSRCLPPLSCCVSWQSLLDDAYGVI